jgi:uncharacterized protein
VVAAWNGLAIAALADAGSMLERPDWVEAAVECADLLVRIHLDDHGRLARVSREGRVGQHPGVLEDYADVAEGLHALVAATGDPVWLSFAEQLVDVVVTHFARPSGGFFDAADDSLDSRLSVIKRPQDPTDNATPSGLSAAAGSLLSFAAYTGSSLHRDAASGALGVYDVLADQAPRFAGWGLAVAEALAAGPAEVAVVGPTDDQATAVLHRTALLGTTPGAAVVAGDPRDAASQAVPLLRDRPLVGGRPAAYVCRQFVCAAPTTDPARLAAEIGARHDGKGRLEQVRGTGPETAPD